MKWFNSSDFQEKIFNFVEKFRKYKFVIATISIIVAVILFFYITNQVEINQKYIELMGPNTINLYVGDEYEELGFNAYDKNNNLYNDDVIIESNLNVNIPGKYKIIYKIGNESITRNVVVIAKPEKYYEIVLEEVNEDKNLYLKINSEFNDPGYKILDNEGVDITLDVEVEITSDVDTSKEGTYTIIYEFIGPNGEEISTKRDVIIFDNKLDLKLSTSDYTNLPIVIEINAQDEYFDYLLMPNEEIITESNYSYIAESNGVYKFVLYNKKGFNVEEIIEVTNIDKQLPSGSCIAIIENNKTTISVDAIDNIGISKYVIDNKEYTTNEFVLNYENVNNNITIYDKSGNTSNITCNLVKKNITLTKSNNSSEYTNENINIEVNIKDDNFSYLKLPNDSIIYSTNYTYQVTQNGTYTFTSYNIYGEATEKSIVINNIDKELPSGSCVINKDNNGAYIEITSNDNIGIKNYLYNGKSYSSKKINLSTIPSTAKISIYDKANNKLDINCKNLTGPRIDSITKDGVIINISASKSGTDISGYYFSYTNVRPGKDGGYVATNKTKLDIVRLPGTTYVWVEDKNGNISEAKSITLDNSVLFDTNNSKYTILEDIKLSTYLTNKGWSIDELNNLIARSSRAAGLYTKQSAATAGVALQTVLAQKYNIKIPYWWGGKSWSYGAKTNWGEYKKKYSEQNDLTYYYYGLDCSGFTTWAYVNAGYSIASSVYPRFWDYNKLSFTKENGEIGDFITNSGHVKLIIGKTDSAFITAEAKGKKYGMVISTHAYSKTNGYTIRKGESLMNIYSKVSIDKYPTGF